MKPITRERALRDKSLVLILHPALEIVSIADQRFQIRGFNDNLTFEDESGDGKRLLDRMDGITHVAEILADLPEEDLQNDVLKLISSLYERGILVEASSRAGDDPFLAQIDLLRRQSITAPETMVNAQLGVPVTELSECTVSLYGAGALFNNVMSILSTYGVSVTPNPAERPAPGLRSVAVVCADEDRRDTFRRHNADLVKAGMATLYASLGEFVLRVGPLVVPKETACFECYHRRRLSLAMHPEEFLAFGKHNENRSVSGSRTPLMAAHLGACLTASTLLKYLCGLANHANVGGVLEMSIISNKTAIEPVLRLPRCSVCGVGNETSVQRAIRSWAPS